MMTIKLRRHDLRNMLVGLVCAVAILLLFQWMFSGYGEGFDKSLAGKNLRVSWTEVNVRESPHGKILYQLQKGDTVVLNGYTYEYVDGPVMSWVQLVDGNWMTREAFSGNWR